MLRVFLPSRSARFSLGFVSVGGLLPLPFPLFAGDQSLSVLLASPLHLRDSLPVFWRCRLSHQILYASLFLTRKTPPALCLAVGVLRGMVHPLPPKSSRMVSLVSKHFRYGIRVSDYCIARAYPHHIRADN